MSTSFQSSEILWTQAQAAITESSESFHRWILDLPADFSPRQWQQLLIEIAGQKTEPQSKGLSEPTSYFEAFSESILYHLESGNIRLAYLLSHALTKDCPQSESENEIYLISKSKLIDYLKETASSIDGTASLKFLAILLRNLVFELDPFDIHNNLLLMLHHAEANDEFSISVYLNAAIEALHTQNKEISILSDGILQHSVRYLLDKCYDEFFFDLATAIARFCSHQDREQECFYAVLSQLATFYSPHRITDYSGLWILDDLLSQNVSRIIRGLFYRSANKGYSILGESLEKIALVFENGYSNQVHLLSESANYFLQAGQLERVKSILNYLLHLYPVKDLSYLTIDQENWQEVYALSCVFLMRISTFWSYLSDDQSRLRAFLQEGGNLFSRCIQFKANQREMTWHQYQSFDRIREKLYPARPLKIGYLSNAFHSHSVGMLSYQTIIAHDPTKVQTYCYYYEGIQNRELALNDYIYREIQENSHQFCVMNGELLSFAEMIRSDGLDILIYMDTMTSHSGCLLTALRLAPIQISWLGGDSPGLPEIDYCFADPYVLAEGSQAEYREKIIRLPTYACTSGFPVNPVDRQLVRQQLKATDENVVFLTAANATKRTQECIKAQLEILRQVPHGVLVVKGIGEIAAVIETYKEKAETLGVSDRLRFLETATYQADHRGQLPAFDLILDTFPYTGATHTMEALYMGVPVLTKVGRHYYGRMSYSLLKNIQLEECITWSVDDYIAQAVRLASEPNLLDNVKAKVKASYPNSVIWDPVGFCQVLENVYHHLALGMPFDEYTFAGSHPLSSS
ncbi:MAG: hypothetical protein NW237_11595 [Cyanobacteriota bacterium]|nr:hypothetical protein [Cyanobacteriota bacterium]